VSFLTLLVPSSATRWALERYVGGSETPLTHADRLKGSQGFDSLLRSGGWRLEQYGTKRKTSHT